jgi:putative transcriptional regulator
MSKKKSPLSKKEIEAWENDRNLLSEISEGVSEYLTSDKAEQKVVEVSEAIHARRMSGFSQSEFATKLGVSIRTYQEWEQGRRQPTGAARVLLHLISKKPELVAELM